MATKEQLKEWIVNNQDKQGKEGKDGQDFEKVKAKYLSLRGEDKPTKTGDYSTGAERARTVAQGLTLGFADEIEAGARSLFSDRGYKEIRDEIRQDTNDFRKDNPKQALALELAGGVVIPGGVLRTGGKLAVGKVANQLKKPRTQVNSQSVQRPVRGQTNKKLSQERLMSEVATDPVSNSANTYKRVMGTNAALGGVYGVGASEKDSISGVASDGALGGTIGGVAGGALLGIGRQLRPLVNRDAQQMAEKAIKRAESDDPLIRRNANFVTRGQAEVSSSARAGENQLANVLKSVKEGRARGLEGYNIKVFDDVFTMLEGGSSNARSVRQFKKQLARATNNKQRLQAIRDMSDTNYKNIYKDMKIDVNSKDLKKQIAKWYTDASKRVTEKKTKKYLDNTLNSITNQFKYLDNATGAQKTSLIKSIFKRLKDSKKFVRENKQKDGDFEELMKLDGSGSVFDDLDDIILGNINKNSPSAMSRFYNAQYAYRAISNLDDVVSKSTGKGLFTPNQVNTAFSDKYQLAGNIARKNKALGKGVGGIAEEAQERWKKPFGDTVPNSGTAENIISTGSLLGLGGLIGSGAVLNPAVLGVIAAVGAKAFQYSPMMTKRFNKMIANQEYRLAADMLEKYALTSGASGLAINQLVNELRQAR